MLFFIRFQFGVTIDCTRKFYTHLQLFVREHAAALYKTKGAADISVGLNEAGMTVLHCYRLFIQMFRQMSPSSVSSSAKDNSVPGASRNIPG